MKKELIGHVYNYGSCGMANILISIENLLLVAKYTKRELLTLVYKDEPHYTEKEIFDLFDFNQSEFKVRFVKIGKEDEIATDLAGYKTFEFDFHGYTVLGSGDDVDKEFLSGRTYYNLDNYVQFERLITKNDRTLSFYSYLFKYDKDAFEWVNKAITPKEKYLQIAEKIKSAVGLDYYSEVNSIHVRRGDAMQVFPKNRAITCENFYPIVKNCFSATSVVLIHSDENNLEYFYPLFNNGAFKQVFHIDRIIASCCPTLDTMEKGLISMIIATTSKNFIGTMHSTFSGIIHRKTNKGKKFKYLYSQFDSLKLNQYGETITTQSPEFNDVAFTQAKKENCLFWIREWEFSQ